MIGGRPSYAAAAAPPPSLGAAVRAHPTWRGQAAGRTGSPCPSRPRRSGPVQRAAAPSTNGGHLKEAVVARVLRAVCPGHPRGKVASARTLKRRRQRQRAGVARSSVTQHNGGVATEWVVDTGASRHVCPPAAVRGHLRPSGCAVETANGKVRALGEATVLVPGLRAEVDTVVLSKTPCLLSVGLLVRQGYELRWGPGGCTLHLPSGHIAPLRVAGGVPVLRGQDVPSGPFDAAGGELAAAAAEHGAVREGVAEHHRQQGHYPWSRECGTCTEAAMRSAQHRRMMPHAGVLAVDLVSLSVSGPHVLVGATQQPGWAYAEPVRSRAASCMREPLLRMVIEAKRRGVVTSVHSDREAGLEALEGVLLAQGVSLATTQGRDPQANGLAEHTVGQLCRMARAVLAHYDQGVARHLWQHAMIWASQRIVGPKMPPFGAVVLARHPPLAPLGKLSARAIRAIYLHKSKRTAGASCVGILAGQAVLAVAARRTIRAALAEDGKWVFPAIASVRTNHRGRPAGQGPQPPADRPAQRGEQEHMEDGFLPEDDVPWGEMIDEDDVPFGIMLEANRAPNLNHGANRPAAPASPSLAACPDAAASGPGGDVGGAWRLPTCGRLCGDDDDKADSAHEGTDKRAPGATETEPEKRRRVEHATPHYAHDASDGDALMGFVTRLVPLGSPEAQTPEAQAAIRKEMANMLSKGVFDPTKVEDWSVVRGNEPEAVVGKAKMILGIKNSELQPEEWVHKGRLVYMGNNLRGAVGERVVGTTDSLYGTPISLATARYVLAVALLRDWAPEAADVDGAYLMADLGGPPVYMRLTQALWSAAGACMGAVSAARDPCLRVRKAMYGLPRAGFDWFAHIDGVLVALGWSRHSGVDSVYTKTDAVIAVYVDDILLAGTPHAKRREWAAIRGKVRLRGDPERLDRFLGVKYELHKAGKHSRTLRATQKDYTASVVRKYDEAAPHPAGCRAAPAVHRSATSEEPGERTADCRSFVGSLMYIVRATRPDATYAVNRLARSVSCWTREDDADLQQVVGYLRETIDMGLEMTVDVRDRKSEMWLELWVDSDHAGAGDRRSTGGWVLLLRGGCGTRITLDWASRKQNVVARSSGEAETVALHGAVSELHALGAGSACEAAGLAVGVNRGLCTGALPAVDFLEKTLGQKVPVRVMVDASVAKAAAEKGTSRQMRYLSKAQGIELFWLRDMVNAIPLDVRKVDGLENLADAFTKPLPGPRVAALREGIGVVKSNTP